MARVIPGTGWTLVPLADMGRGRGNPVWDGLAEWDIHEFYYETTKRSQAGSFVLLGLLCLTLFASSKYTTCGRSRLVNVERGYLSFLHSGQTLLIDFNSLSKDTSSHSVLFWI